jgi:hypothetical protein
VTFCTAVIEDGAVYKPLVLIEPMAGFNDQVTAVLPEPVTDALNCCFCDSPIATLDGVTPTTTGAGGTRVTVATADLLGSATLVARTDTVWVAITAAGAV